MMFLTVKIYSRLPPAGKSVNYRMVEKKILDRILSPSIYDSQIRPKAQNFCLNVFMIFVGGIFNICAFISIVKTKLMLIVINDRRK